MFASHEIKEMEFNRSLSRLKHQSIMSPTIVRSGTPIGTSQTIITNTSTTIKIPSISKAITKVTANIMTKTGTGNATADAIEIVAGSNSKIKTIMKSNDNYKNKYQNGDNYDINYNTKSKFKFVPNESMSSINIPRSTLSIRTGGLILPNINITTSNGNDTTTESDAQLQPQTGQGQKREQKHEKDEQDEQGQQHQDQNPNLNKNDNHCQNVAIDTDIDAYGGHRYPSDHDQTDGRTGTGDLDSVLQNETDNKYCNYNCNQCENNSKITGKKRVSFATDIEVNTVTENIGINTDNSNNNCLNLNQSRKIIPSLFKLDLSNIESSNNSARNNNSNNQKRQFKFDRGKSNSMFSYNYNGSLNNITSQSCSNINTNYKDKTCQANKLQNTHNRASISLIDLMQYKKCIENSTFPLKSQNSKRNLRYIDTSGIFAAKQNSLIEVMTKETILVSFSVIASMIGLIGIILIALDLHMHYFSLKYDVLFLMLSIDVAFNVISLSLTWPFAKKWYNKLCFATISCVKEIHIEKVSTLRALETRVV